MFKLVKLAIGLLLVVFLVWFGASVPLGKHTLFGHISRIWNSEETQDLVEGTKEGAGPAVERVKRGVKAGMEEASREETPDAAAKVEEALAPKKKPKRQ